MRTAAIKLQAKVISIETRTNQTTQTQQQLTNIAVR